MRAVTRSASFFLVAAAVGFVIHSPSVYIAAALVIANVWLAARAVMQFNADVAAAERTRQ